MLSSILQKIVFYRHIGFGGHNLKEDIQGARRELLFMVPACVIKKNLGPLVFLR